MRITKRDIIVLCVIIVLFIVSLIIIKVRQPKSDDTIVYSDNPKDWVVRNDSGYTVDLIEASQGLSYKHETFQQHVDGHILTAFVVDARYNGQSFTKEYTDEEGYVLMKVNQGLTPNDGIIEAEIYETIKDAKPYVYIFLDEDWKKNLPETYIVYGSSYENEVMFEFNELKNGIYFMELPDDPTRFDKYYSYSFGGVIVGDINKEDIFSDISSSTYVRLR